MLMPKVLSPDADDNVFVFWSSHGEPGSLDFGKNQSMDYARMRGIIENTPHRKLLMAVEACYSGGLGEARDGFPWLPILPAHTSKCITFPTTATCTAAP